MSSSSILKSVKERFPELKQLPAPKLKLVEEALVYATQLAMNDILSEVENDRLMRKIGRKSGITPANSLKAYRMRENLTQKGLSGKSKITQANISSMEQGKRPIGLAVAKKLAAILGCDYKKLI